MESVHRQCDVLVWDAEVIHAHQEFLCRIFPALDIIVGDLKECRDDLTGSGVMQGQVTQVYGVARGAAMKRVEASRDPLI